MVSQTNFTQGVSIRPDTLPPHPSAILEVSSNSKGVLFPRIRLDEGETLDAKITTVSDGLIVYVDNADSRKGFWIYQITDGTGAWYHLRKSRTAFPFGTILNYSLQGEETLESLFPNGVGQGKMQGWYLCNGQNGTPDLRGRFVCGIGGSDSEYSDYGDDFLNPNQYGALPQVAEPGNNKVPNNSQTLTSTEVPPHKHVYEEGTNPLLEHAHQHTIDKEKTKHAHYIPVLTGECRKGMGFIGTKRARKSKTQELLTDFDAEEVFTCEEQEQVNRAPIDDIKVTSTGNESPEDFDNRPVFYVMVFIIRSDGQFDFNDLNQYKTEYVGFDESCPSSETGE